MLPAEYLDPLRFMLLPREVWREVLDAAGDNARLRGVAFTEKELVQSLVSTPPDDKLADALEVIFELGTEVGRELLLNAAEDRQVSLGLVEHVPAAELVAQLWLKSQGDVALREVLLRARVSSLGAEHIRAKREFVGKSPKAATGLDRDRMKDAVSKKCVELQQSEALDVDVYLSGAEWRCDVLRGDAAKRVLEIREGRAGVLNYKPASSDHLRYDPETGRLAISTRSPRRLKMYREVVGQLLAEDSEFFAGENICSLKPLQDQGNKLFVDNRPVGIRHVDVTELRWRRGDRDKIAVSGRDCFQLLGDLGARLREGELVEAKLAIDFAGQTRRGTVLIKVPNRIEVKGAGARENLVEQLLDRVGIRGNFEEGDRKDFWSLYPWRLSPSTWRQHLGADFERLVRSRVLRRQDLDAVTHPHHPAAVGALRVEVVDANTIVGVSEDAAIPSRTLTHSDLEAYEPDLPRVTAEIVRVVELTGPVTELMNGLWSLGRRELSPSSSVAVFAALREPFDGALPLLREAGKGAHAVLLVPPGCSCALQTPLLEFDFLRGPHQELLSRIIEVLELESDVSPVLWARADLVFDERLGKAWYKAVELTHLRAGTQPWIFAVTVARAEGVAVPKDELRSKLSPNSTDEGLVRKAKKDFGTAVAKSYADQGRECEDADMFSPAGSGGYRLSTTARFV